MLPHALINHVETKLGNNGEKLLEYVKWLHDRIIALRPNESYQPVLHIDVYGTMGIAFNNNLEKIADYMKTLCDAAAPFHLRIEGPVDVGDRTKQMEALRDLTAICDRKNIPV